MRVAPRWRLRTLLASQLEVASGSSATSSTVASWRLQSSGSVKSVHRRKKWQHRRLRTSPAASCCRLAAAHLQHPAPSPPGSDGTPSGVSQGRYEFIILCIQLDRTGPAVRWDRNSGRWETPCGAAHDHAAKWQDTHSLHASPVEEARLHRHRLRARYRQSWVCTPAPSVSSQAPPRSNPGSEQLGPSCSYPCSGYIEAFKCVVQLLAAVLHHLHRLTSGLPQLNQLRLWAALRPWD